MSAGYGLPLDAGWVSLLQMRLKEHGYQYQIVNASVSGETTLGGRNRIEALLETYSPKIVVIELGANDGLRGLSPDAVHDNLQTIIDASRRQGAQVLLVGMRLPPNYGTAYIKKFENVYRDLAREKKVRLAPFLLEGFADQRELFQPDGVHPTREAQPRMLENVWTELESMLMKPGKRRGEVQPSFAGSRPLLLKWTPQP